MKILTLYSLAFQRNGIMGEPFYTALVKFEDGADTIDNFLLTFRVIESDKKIDFASCRANSLGDLTTAWRGDEVGYMMQKFFNDQMEAKGGTIYDCCTKTEIYSV